GTDAPLPVAARPGSHRAAQALLEGGASQSVREPLELRRGDARSRERAGEGAGRHAARPRGPGRLRRDHRSGRGAEHRARRGGAGATVAVFGAGGVGLAAIQGARIAGARMIIAVDVFASKLALARELGATHAVDASAGDPVKEIRDLTGGGVEYSFEAIGLK